MLQQLKAGRAGRIIKRSRIFRFLKESNGNWQYPLIKLGWVLAGGLVPRRWVDIDGVKFNLSCTNWITHFRWYLFKTKEQEVRHFIDQYVKDGDVFFDIGANVGVFSIYAAKKFDNIRVYSFEPEFSNLNLLKDNIICNQLPDRVKPYSLAVSDFDGMSSLNIQDYTPGAAVHTENRDTIDKTDEGYRVIWSEGVCAMTVDSICEQLKVIPSIMKLDTDGNEDKILQGARKVLRDPRLRSLVIEMPLPADKMRFCEECLSTAGFKKEWSDPAKTRNQIWGRQSSDQ